MNTAELRRLLELAAKAVGYGTHHGTNSVRMLLSTPVVALVVHDADGRLISTGWNPADDDGESRQLEVALFLTVAVRRHEIEVFDEHGYCLCSIPVDTENDDLAAATRLAVLKAAAEIGRSME